MTRITIIASAVLAGACAAPPRPVARAPDPPATAERVIRDNGLTWADPASPPSWWSQAPMYTATGCSLVARSRAPDVSVAASAAMVNARAGAREMLGGEPASIVVQQGGYTRHGSGLFDVALMVVAEPPKVAAPVTASAAPAAPSVEPARPPWWLGEPVEIDGRVHACAERAAPALVDARRQAVDAARDVIIRAVRGEADVATERIATARRDDGWFVVQVRVSAPSARR